MDCGKSTLALQVDHNQTRQGRSGLLVTQGDRSARPMITSRVGLQRPAEPIDAGTDLRLLVRERWAAGLRVDYLIADEAQFLSPGQVDQLAELVDESHVDVFAFGLTTDFRAELFPGTRRLLELADDVERVQVRGAVLVRRAGPAQRPGGRRRRRPRGSHGGRRRHRVAQHRRARLGALPGALPAALRARPAGSHTHRTGAVGAPLSRRLTRPGGRREPVYPPMR